MKLMVLDGNSIVNRAFFGVRYLSAPDGTPTNAIFGFFNILDRLIRTYQPDSLCVAFDLKGPTFRHKACEFYKATRKPMPEELAVQIPIIKDILDLMKINRYEADGYEADDVLGTIGRICDESGWECVVVTGDRDSLQLITDRVNVCLVKTNDETLYTREVFEQEYGFEPIHLIDLKALMGDSSDNIPGVAGIGQKTATSLIQKYHSINRIFENLDKIEATSAVKAKLSAGIDSAKQCYWLATIFTQIPLEFRPEEAIWKREYKEELYGLLNSLNLKRMIEKWGITKPKEIVFPDEDEAPLPDNIIVTADLKTMYKEGFSGRAFDTTIAQYLIDPTAKKYESKISYFALCTKLKELGLQQLYENIELPLCRVLAEMENEGIKVNEDALTAFSVNLGEKMNLLTQSIYFQAGREFNINSPKQLGEILFDELGLPAGKKRSTNVDALESIRYLHPIIDDILEYRELSKLKSTYADGLREYIDSKGRIHTTFQQTVTATGRLSSSEPNLQNIPIRKQLGAEIRGMFIPEPGNVLIDADYSQIELRLLAHMSGDQEMIQAFLSGEDFHTVTASKVFNVPIEEVTPSLRSRAKAVNFGIIYGISAFSLAQDIGVTTSEAKKYMAAYFEKYADVDRYMKSVVERARKDGFVSTLYGRRRSLPELSSSNFNVRSFGERVALNMPIQGTAADIIKLAMISVYREIANRGLQARLILQVHDELLLECPEKEKDEVAALLKECMEKVGNFSVPLVTEVGIGRTWAEAH